MSILKWAGTFVALSIVMVAAATFVEMRLTGRGDKYTETTLSDFLPDDFMKE